MFQLEKRKKICGSRRKEEEEVSSEEDEGVQDHIKQYWFSEHGLILTFRPSRKGYHFDCICEGQWSQ